MKPTVVQLLPIASWQPMECPSRLTIPRDRFRWLPVIGGSVTDPKRRKHAMVRSTSLMSTIMCETYG